MTAKRRTDAEIDYLMELIRNAPPLPPRAKALQQQMAQVNREKQTDAQPRLFKDGDQVRNINPRSQYYQLIGTFKRYFSAWTFCHGPGCDVAYPGHTGPYGYFYVAQSARDLEQIHDT